MPEMTQDCSSVDLLAKIDESRNQFRSDAANKADEYRSKTVLPACGIGLCILLLFLFPFGTAAAIGGFIALPAQIRKHVKKAHAILGKEPGTARSAIESLESEVRDSIRLENSDPERAVSSFKNADARLKDASSLYYHERRHRDFLRQCCQSKL